jgi:hypothetical protein
MPTPFEHYTIASTFPPDAAEWRAEVESETGVPGRYSLLLLRFGGADTATQHGLTWTEATERADAWASQPPRPRDLKVHAKLDELARAPSLTRELRQQGDTDATWDTWRECWVENDAALRRRISEGSDR